MGNKLSIEEINECTEQQLIELKEDEVKFNKQEPHVKKRVNERLEIAKIDRLNTEYARKFQTIKLVLVGDTHVGKSSLITTYLTNTFCERSNTNTVLDQYRGTKKVKSQPVIVEIIDTAGDLDKYREYRQELYQGADCFMICFSTDSMNSFEHIDSWANEIRQVEEEKPIALNLTKYDLVDDLEINEPVDKEMVEDKRNDQPQQFQLYTMTSAKLWQEDYNVHKAFNRILVASYDLKYG